jgi:superfamily II DNA/RNA helicase
MDVPAEPTSPPVLETWEEYTALSEHLLRGIYNFGFERPSQIQKTAILPLMEGHDLIAQAPSGTGKTGAFSVGVLHRVDASRPVTQAILLAPTHELVVQIHATLNALGEVIPGLLLQTLVGGTPVAQDADILRSRPPHIVIGTPGRVFDMIRRRHLKVHDVHVLVMDEADEMLSGNFKEQIHNIVCSLDASCQIALFSATLGDDVLGIAHQFLQSPVKITMDAPQLNLEGIQQFFVALPDDRVKYDALKDLFGQLSVNQSIIYVNSVPRVNQLYDAMVKDGFSVCCIHSSMRREERERAFLEFRTGVFRVLISSNVTARGIDIQQVSTVVNFDVPRDPHTYLHRIGRSGRWGRKGVAINFITRNDVPTLRRIENYYRSTIQELPNDFSKFLQQ